MSSKSDELLLIVINLMNTFDYKSVYSYIKNLKTLSIIFNARKFVMTRPHLTEEINQYVAFFFKVIIDYHINEKSRYKFQNTV